ncbi:MAG TPA: ribosome-associated translation inhibitor RaiA [Candidatus Saccharimonadales bacterium]|nr:ribosome-associated translation inhibitor RaiA [Candidatus Saccharimonadales bacterium]
MIKRLNIDGVHMDVGEDLKKYVAKKIGRLDRYIPKASRESVLVDIKLKEGKAKDKNERTCEIILHLPQETLTIKETTINIYAAIDIAETKLRNQLKKYKDLHASPRLHQRLISRLKHRPAAAAE